MIRRERTCDAGHDPSFVSAREAPGASTGSQNLAPNSALRSPRAVGTARSSNVEAHLETLGHGRNRLRKSTPLSSKNALDEQFWTKLAVLSKDTTLSFRTTSLTAIASAAPTLRAHMRLQCQR
eukprot:TRINITY_DN19881_c0_g2_i1.p2 TRINITY_DN19881_c0_g2~~TRINITY_DN19881_c0_g2_i1.p2  ORF type:complete len:123 (+),score=6.09 TRINITY_DN19881_c0_g2_i1:376-744(+)